MKRILLGWLAAVMAVCCALYLPGTVLAEPGVVHIALFYSPSCGHCHYVISEVLPPLMEQYGAQVRVAALNVGSADGQALYQAAIERFAIPADRRGVPTLIVGETVLVGSVEIPEQLPGLIEQYLAEGGVGWPDIPGLEQVLAASEAAEPTAEVTPEETAVTAALAPAPPTRSQPQITNLDDDLSAPDDILSRLRRDPEGNALSILLLVGIAAVLISVARRWRFIWTQISKAAPFAGEFKSWRGWAVGALCLVGLGVSVYMAYVETTRTPAVCGPIGDCNTVQQSDYAVLFGLVPVGILGIVGYAAVLLAWAGTFWGRGRIQWLAETVLFGMALFGTLFSAYLTFLEPFVIGASCAWCLTSALSMTLILLLVAGAIPVRLEPGQQAARP